MKNNKGIILVLSQHIEPGIKKYDGKVDEQLKSLMKNAGFQYTPYLFCDGRILLVMPHNTSAFLYPSKAALYDYLQLSE